MSDFEPAIQVVLANEGGLIDNPNDPGGITNRGISLRFLQSCGSRYDINRDGKITREDIINLTQDKIILIYRREFWDPQSYGHILQQRLTNYIFDTAVALGASTTHKCVQGAICAYQGNSSLPVDGVLGINTLNAINNIGLPLIVAIKAMRAAYYRCEAKFNKNTEDELHGLLERAYRG